MTTGHELSEMLKEEKRVAEGAGPLTTPAQLESDEHNNRGWELHCQHRFEEALREYEAAVGLNPRHALALNNKGLSLRRMSRFPEALQCFRDAITVAPRFVKPYSNLGETYGMMGEVENSARWFKKALEVEPGYPRAMQGLQQYCGRGPSETEQKRADDILKRSPQAAMLLAEAAGYMGIAQFGRALLLLENALKLVPDSSDIVSARVDCLMNLGRFAEALEAAKKSIALDSTNASAWVSLAWAHLQLGEYDESLRCSQRAISLDAKHDMAWNNAGGALMMQGRFREAIDKFDRALSLSPNNARAKMNREACARRSASPQCVLLGWESLAVARPALANGDCVAVSFNFNDPRVPWKEVIELAGRYPSLVVVDLVDRGVDEIRAMAARLQQWGSPRLALDMTIRAAEKTRKGD